MPDKASRAKRAAKLYAEREDLTAWEVAPTRQAKSPSLLFSLRLPPEEIDRLQERAARTGKTVSSVVRQAIQEYFEGRRLPGNVVLDSADISATEARQATTDIPQPNVETASAPRRVA